MKSQIYLLKKDNSTGPIVEACADALRGARFSDDYTGQFTDSVISILNDSAELLGEGTEVKYRIIKTFFRFELRLYIAGEFHDLFTSGRGARKRFFDNLPSLNLNNETIHISERYAFNCNIISVSIPMQARERKLFKDPMILAVILGILCGLLCQHLPKEANSFIIDKLASPIMSIILDLLSGIMGPVIFFSMITSILTFSSVKELTSMGVKIIKRFILITLFIMAVSIFVSFIFFRGFGEGSLSFVPDQLIKMLLDIIPTNFIKPFLDNDPPQLVLLGFLLGSALLLLGGSVKELNTVIMQIDKCVMSAMNIILLVIPAIPFLSIMVNIGKTGVFILLGAHEYGDIEPQDDGQSRARDVYGGSDHGHADVQFVYDGADHRDPGAVACLAGHDQRVGHHV